MNNQCGHDFKDVYGNCCARDRLAAENAALATIISRIVGDEEISPQSQIVCMTLDQFFCARQALSQLGARTKAVMKALELARIAVKDHDLIHEDFNDKLSNLGKAIQALDADGKGDDA